MVSGGMAVVVAVAAVKFGRGGANGSCGRRGDIDFIAEVEVVDVLT